MLEWEETHNGGLTSSKMGREAQLWDKCSRLDEIFGSGMKSAMMK